MKKLFCLILCLLLTASFALVSCVTNPAVTTAENSTPKADTTAANADAAKDTTVEAGTTDAVTDSGVTGADFTFYTSYAKPKGSSDKTANGANLTNWFTSKDYEYDDNYNIKAPSEFDSVVEYVFRIPSGWVETEIDIFKLASGADTTAATSMAEYRKAARIANGDYTLYGADVAMISGAKVLTAGNFVLYVCTSDSAATVATAQAFITSNPDCSALELYKALGVE